MLHVDRRVDVNAGVEHVLDVLVSLLVLQSGGVGVRELVDQGELRYSADQPGEVHLLKDRVPVGNPAPRQELQTVRLLDGLLATVRLQISDHHVPPGLGLGSSLLKHPVGLPDAGGHPQEDLEAAAFDAGATGGSRPLLH